MASPRTPRSRDPFPKGEPTFVLEVATDGRSVEIGIAGGEYANGGETITLGLAKKLTLQNTADGSRYELELRTIPGQPVPKSKKQPGRYAPAMVPEAQLEQTTDGLVAKTEGWFVLNAREARWYHAEGRSAFCDFEGDVDFAQLGINISVLGPGESMAMYHWEADQEDFLVVAGEAVLIVEGEERPLRRWDFVHCPPNTKHTIVGAGDGPCVVVAVGAREHDGRPDWGGYTVDEVAARHGASAKVETSEPTEAYAHLTRRQPTGYRDGWLPGTT